jgi:hypothetical protein
MTNELTGLKGQVQYCRVFVNGPTEPVPIMSRVVGAPATFVAHNSHFTMGLKILLAAKEKFDNCKLCTGCALTTIAKRTLVPGSATLNNCPDAKDPAAKFPPGADVVSMIANVLFSARGGGDGDVVCVEDRVPDGDRVKDGVSVGDFVKEGVCDGDRVKDGVSVRDGVNDGVSVRDGEVDRLLVPDGVKVLDGVRVLLSDDPDDGVALDEGVTVGVTENIGAPRI